MLRIQITALLILIWQCSFAQSWVDVHTTDAIYDGVWTFPYAVGDITDIDFNENGEVLRMHRNGETDDVISYIPFETELLDSVTFVDDPDSLTKNKYRVFSMNITIENFDTLVCYYHNPAFPDETNGGRQDWYRCYISIDGKGEYPSYSGTGRIRGRGNSSWRWYPKKPFKISLDTKSKILGIGKARKWVFLANYRDVTDLMNTFPFIVGKMTGVAYCTKTRYVEVFINGEYKGLYQMTEQVEQGSNRVDISKDKGIFITIDTDDGDDTWKYNTDSTCFWSDVYNLPIGVKYPKDADKATRDSVRAEFAKLETAIKNGRYDALDSICDIKSYIALLQLNDLVDNADFPNRSVFLSKDGNGKWRFGPAWDYDAGYSLDYYNQYQSCTFFTDYTGMRVSPSSTSHYYDGMFKSGKFTKAYIDQWNQYKDSLMSVCWTETMKYAEGMREDNDGLSAMEREMLRWPKADKNGTHDPTQETENMRVWLTNRIDYMTEQINAFTIPTFDNGEGGDGPDPDPDDPDPDDPTDDQSYGYGLDIYTDSMTRVGGETVSASYNLMSVRSMDKQNISLDMDKILACFPEGTELSDLVYMAYDNLSTHELTQKKSSSDGFYMNFEGQVCTYGSQIMQCKIGYKADSGALTFAYTGFLYGENKCTASVFLVLDEQYYYELKMDVSLSYSY